MIEKVSFESAVPRLRTTSNNNIVHSKYKNEALYNSQTYILAALAGLAVIGIGCLFGKNKNVQKTVKQAVNQSERVINKSAKDTTSVSAKPAVPTPAVHSEPKVTAKPKKQDIDIKHLDANERNFVSKALDETVTPQMQEAYNKEAAFQPLKGDKKKAAKRLRINNKRQNQRVNTLGANLQEGVLKKLNGLFNKNPKQSAMIIPINSGKPRRFSA